MDKRVIWLSLLVCILEMTNAQLRDEGGNFINFTLLHTALLRGAVRLDGTPPAYAYVEGTGGGSRNWVVFMEGGGWCVTKEDCLDRSTKYYGSSSHKLNEGLTSVSGIFDSDSRYNPDFYNWHKVYIHYCDGSLYMSDIEQVDRISNLTFRGARIYKVMMEEMLRKGMWKAENVIFAGSSAGGLATILHCDRFRALFLHITRVKCLSDSGFFIHGKGPFADVSEHHFAEVVEIHKLAESLPTSCTSKRDPNLCLFPEYLVADVDTPLFLVESTFDRFQIEYNLESAFGGKTVWSNCTSNFMLCNSTQLGILKDFRTAYIDTLVGLDNCSSRGMFADSCFTHTHITRRRGWTCSGVLASKTIGGAVADWFFDRSWFREIDDGEVPKNCSNTVGVGCSYDRHFLSNQNETASVRVQ